MGQLDRIFDVLDKGSSSDTGDLKPLFEAIRMLVLSNLQPILDAVERISIPEPKEADLKPLMDAINRKSVDIAPVLDAINAQNVDLQPVLDAINNIEMDLNPLLDALNQIKMPEMPEPKPVKWVLTHERNFQGLIVKTEAVSE